eukprot:11258276-Alexandrium_andersonii.AAC.1
MYPEAVAERRCKAQAHLEFVVQLRRSKLERGAHFLREHPATASFWGEQCVFRFGTRATGA